MKTRVACRVILHRDMDIRPAILEAGVSVLKTYSRGETLYQVIGGRWHGWCFVETDEWVSKHLEV